MHEGRSVMARHEMSAGKGAAVKGERRAQSSGSRKEQGTQKSRAGVESRLPRLYQSISWLRRTMRATRFLNSAAQAGGGEELVGCTRHQQAAMRHPASPQVQAHCILDHAR